MNRDTEKIVWMILEQRTCKLKPLVMSVPTKIDEHSYHEQLGQCTTTWYKTVPVPQKIQYHLLKYALRNAFSEEFAYKTMYGDNGARPFVRKSAPMQPGSLSGAKKLAAIIHKYITT